MRRLASMSLGILAALFTLGVVIAEAVDWSQHEPLRLPPVSQVGYFVGLAVFAAVGATEGVLAIRRPGNLRAAAMMAMGGTLLLGSALAAASLSETGALLWYPAVIGLVAGSFASAEAPRPWLSGLAGLLASVPLLLALLVASRVIERLFP